MAPTPARGAAVRMAARPVEEEDPPAPPAELDPAAPEALEPAAPVAPDTELLREEMKDESSLEAEPVIPEMADEAESEGDDPPVVVLADPAPPAPPAPPVPESVAVSVAVAVAVVVSVPVVVVAPAPPAPPAGVPVVLAVSWPLEPVPTETPALAQYETPKATT